MLANWDIHLLELEISPNFRGRTCSALTPPIDHPGSLGNLKKGRVASDWHCHSIKKKTFGPRLSMPFYTTKAFLGSQMPSKYPVPPSFCTGRITPSIDLGECGTP